MSETPPCPECHSEYSYIDRDFLNCSSCGHEWVAEQKETTQPTKIFKDANGNTLQDGDTVSVLKDLKVKGTSLVIKVGTKVKGIKLIEGDHDIDCKIKGIGQMQLKTKFVKKVN